MEEQVKFRVLPLTEGSGINDHDGVLDEGLGPDQLVVAGVVDDINDPRAVFQTLLQTLISPRAGAR